MKNLAFKFLLGTAIAFTACNQKDSKNQETTHDMSAMTTDTAAHVSPKDDVAIKAIPVSFTNVDGKAAASIKTMVDHYLHIKTALANDQPAEAAKGATAMGEAIKKLDKSLLTAEQKNAFDKVGDKLAEHAEQIKANAGKIKEQRSHFVLLSESVYELAKSFGAGRPLYHDHCPMARDNQGAMWLSEEKEIKNPYFGAEMPKCGSVEEVIQ